jgi:hypothetical protein
LRDFVREEGIKLGLLRIDLLLQRRDFIVVFGVSAGFRAAMPALRGGNAGRSERHHQNYRGYY